MTKTFKILLATILIANPFIMMASEQSVESTKECDEKTNEQEFSNTEKMLIDGVGGILIGAITGAFFGIVAGSFDKALNTSQCNGCTSIITFSAVNEALESIDKICPLLNTSKESVNCHMTKVICSRLALLSTLLVTYGHVVVGFN